MATIEENKIHESGKFFTPKRHDIFQNYPKYISLIKF